MSLEGAARVADADISKFTRAVGRLCKGPVAGAFKPKYHYVLRRVSGHRAGWNFHRPTASIGRFPLILAVIPPIRVPSNTHARILATITSDNVIPEIARALALPVMT